MCDFCTIDGQDMGVRYEPYMGLCMGPMLALSELAHTVPNSDWANMEPMDKPV